MTRCPLSRGKITVSLLALMDSFPPEPQGQMAEQGDGDAEAGRGFAAMLGLSLNGLAVNEFVSGAPDPADLLRLAQDRHHPLAGFDAAMVRRLLAVWHNNIELHRQCALGCFGGDLLLFVAGEQASAALPQAAIDLWQPHLGGRILSHTVACEHHAMCRPAPLALIGRLLREHLETLSTDVALTGDAERGAAA